jgi:hypothetical protein
MSSRNHSILPYDLDRLRPQWTAAISIFLSPQALASPDIPGDPTPLTSR